MNRVLAGLQIFQSADFAPDEILQVIKALVDIVETLISIVEAGIDVASQAAYAVVIEQNSQHDAQADQH